MIFWISQDILKDIIVKIETDQILESSENVCLFTGDIKKEENEDADLGELLLKIEEVEIKDEDE